MGIANIISGLVSPITNVVTKWQDGRQKKAERKDRIAEARCVGEITRLQKQADGDINYDIEAQRQMQYSWKDEYLMFVLSLPFIGNFIPVVQDYVKVGWIYSAGAPQWYQWAFTGVICATFGLRGWKAFNWNSSTGGK